MMIEMRDVEKFYKSGSLKSYVLRHVHLDIAAGEFVSIMGPSGAGKSTLLHIMGMLDEPTAAAYRFFGDDVATMKEKARTEVHKRFIGFVFQAYHLIDEPTGNLSSRQGEEVMEMLKELNAEGTTIVQVTHSEKNAAYGSRIVHLLDGKVSSEQVPV